MKSLLSIIILLQWPAIDGGEKTLRSGDIIFQEDCRGATDGTIKAVTASVGDYRFTHVGIVYIDGRDSVYVIEATRPKVAKTPLAEFLYPAGAECYPVSVVGRLKRQHRHCIPEALKEGLRLVGSDYDDGFVPGDDRYYCSELIYEILRRANGGIPVFQLNTMTFRSPDTGETTRGWIEYFAKYGLPIPEGEAGINPGAMSLSEEIEMLFALPPASGGCDSAR